MLKRIFAALGATMLVMGSVGGASAASIDIVANFGTNGLNNLDTYTAVSGTGLADNFTFFDHTYDFTVVTGGLSVDAVIQSIFEPVIINGIDTKEGVTGLTLEWTSNGTDQGVFHVTGDDGLRCTGQTGCGGQSVTSWGALFTTFLGGGAASLHITGTTLELGGSYTLFIQAVPLPAAALLFGSALLGGGLMRRRKMIKEFGLPA